MVRVLVLCGRTQTGEVFRARLSSRAGEALHRVAPADGAVRFPDPPFLLPREDGAAAGAAAGAAGRPGPPTGGARPAAAAAAAAAAAPAPASSSATAPDVDADWVTAAGEERRTWRDPATGSWAAAVARLEEERARHGPFDVVVGFSEGGVLAVMMGARWRGETALVVAAGAPDADDDAAWAWAQPPAGKGAAKAGAADADPYLHVLLFAGARDSIVPPASTRALADRVRRTASGAGAGAAPLQLRVDVEEHDGTHVFPAKAAQVSAFSDALAAAARRPGSQACLDEQRDELEALGSIYAEELAVVRAPTLEGSAAFSVSLDAQFPGVSLEFECGRRYASRGGALYVTVAGPVSASARRRLAAALDGVHRSLLNEPRAFACVSACQDVLAAADAEPVPGTGPVVGGGGARTLEAWDAAASGTASPDVGAEDEEAVDEEAVARALEEASLCKDTAWLPPALDSRPEEGEDAGIWSPFCIGLVGKPSAGKSSFFNAATRVAEIKEQDRERKAAAVGAQPFTTIDPNFGESEVDYESFPGVRGSVPLLIKDVAGLVPGAWKGLGRGNKFLNDVCDAAAIIHVVDASGQLDEQGRERGERDLGAPARDALWIMRELALWIFTNVKAKWPREKRRQGSRADGGDADYAARVCALFSGYRSTPGLCWRAARLAGLDLERAPAFKSDAILRLVAFFIHVRFPVVIALNKCDTLSKAEIELVARSMPPGSAAVVPVSARVEEALQKPQLKDEASEALRQAAAERLGGGSGVSAALRAAVGSRAPLLVAAVSSPGPDAQRYFALFHRGSRVLDLFRALSHRGLVGGDFVRAESWPDLDAHARRETSRGLGRDALLRDGHAVVRVISNRKVAWQPRPNGEQPPAPSAPSAPPAPRGHA